MGVHDADGMRASLVNAAVDIKRSWLDIAITVDKRAILIREHDARRGDLRPMVTMCVDQKLIVPDS